MEQEEVINPGLAIWVTEYSQHQAFPPVWKVNGIAIDAFHGFGDNQTRYFQGDVVLLCLDKKLIQHLSISSVHFSREGFRWLIKDADMLPQAPFLLSSNPKIQIIFDGIVEMKDDKKVIDLSEPDTQLHPVGTRGWFGVITLKGDNKAHLIAFSSHQNLSTLDNDEIWSFDWDCSISKIKTIQNAVLN